MGLTDEDIIAFGTLYKYRDADCPRNWAVLTNQKLWFPTPDTFNDPFDANILMRYDLLEDDVMWKMVTDFRKHDYPFEGDHLRNYGTRNLISQLRNPVSHDDVVRRWNQRLISQVRMFCVCPENDNILLWSHYGNNHKGFAIGFNPVELLRVWREANGVSVGKVSYAEEYPVVLPPVLDESDGLDAEEAFLVMMNVKSKIWEYEQEIRFSLFRGPQNVDFQPELISEIVLGCKISAKHQQQMLDLVDNQYRHVRVLKAKLKRGEFAIAFDILRRGVL